VILVDANLLLYAYDSASPFMRRRKPGWSACSLLRIRCSWRGTQFWHFLRIATNARALESRFSMEEAVRIVSEWLERPMVRIAAPGGHYWEILRDLLPAAECRGPLVSDGHLAALALSMDWFSAPMIAISAGSRIFAPTTRSNRSCCACH
jgi:predicted nucleic acid-binding protein